MWSDPEYSTGFCLPWLWNSLWRQSFCQVSWMVCPRGLACQLQAWLIHLPQLERESLDDGQPPCPEAVMTTEGREANLDQIAHHVVHPALHQDYASDFQSWRATDIAPTLTSPILVGITSSMCLPERPMMPKGPETTKATKGLQGGGEALVQPAIPGPSHIGGPMEMEGRSRWGSSQSILMPPSWLTSPRTQLTSSY